MSTMLATLIAAMGLLPVQARSVGLLFNGGGSLQENSAGKDESMKAEVQSFVDLLQGRGYELEGNIFHRSGEESFNGIRSQRASARAFLSRLETQCRSLKDGDKLALAFSGHGSHSSGHGSRDPSQTIIAYQQVKPKDPKAADLGKHDPNKVAAVLSVVKKLIEAELAGQGIARGLLTELAASLGIKDPEAAERVWRRAAESVDLLRVQRTAEGPARGKASEDAAKAIARYLLMAAAKSDYSREFFDKNFGSDDIPISSIKDALQRSCLDKSVSIRVMGSQCYSGGLLELTTPDGRVCAVSKTNPYNASVYPKGSATLGSGGASLGEMRQKLGKSFTKDPNNDPVSSLDHLTDKWLQEAAVSCKAAPGSSGPVVLKPEYRAAFCTAAAGGLPGVYKINQYFQPSDDFWRDPKARERFFEEKDRHLQQEIPEAVYKLAGLDPGSGLQRKDVYRALFDKIAAEPYQRMAADVKKCLEEPL
ncbi:MAG: hypothetical protein WC728_16695 [Elusimicrobiota bacterium]